MQAINRPFSLTRLIEGHSADNQKLGAYERGVCAALIEKQGTSPWPGAGFVLPTRTTARDLTVGNAQAGGNLLAASVAAPAQSVRPVTVAERAGMRVVEVPDSSASYALPRFSAAAAGFVSEGEAAPALNTTVSTVELMPRTVAARLGFSRRVQLLAPGTEQAVLSEIERATSALIEKAVFQGTGFSKEPLGLLNLEGKLTKTFAAAAPTMAELSDQLELLGDQDIDLERVSWLVHPSDFRDLVITLTGTAGSQIVGYGADGQARLFGRPVYVSSHITEGSFIAADMSAVTLAFFGSPAVITDRFSGGKSTSGQTEIVVLNSFDVGVVNEKAICLGSA